MITIVFRDGRKDAIFQKKDKTRYLWEIDGAFLIVTEQRDHGAETWRFVRAFFYPSDTLLEVRTE